MDNYKGFNNIGNTCYLNSGLQMLMQNLDFCKLIVKNKNASSNLKIMADFIEEYYNDDNKALTPSSIKSLVEKRESMFVGYNQHDSAEFLVFLLDLLDTDLKNKFSNVFEIETTTSIKCKYRSCLKISNVIEKNNFLILPIKSDYTNLDDCYRGYKMREKLEGDEMYNCENCKDKRIAAKRLNVTKWPKHLIVWIKRFENNGHRMNKNNQVIEVPLVWRHNYETVGAVIHQGSINGGHYFYISKTNKEWFICNDSSVSQITEEKAQQYLNRAYLIYMVQNE